MADSETSSKNKGISQVDATARRTWDKAHYERLAKERALEDNTVKAPVIPPSERKLLQRRDTDVDLTSTLNKSRVIASHHDAAGGYYCDACDCVLKDSISYLDHINGKKHALKLGMSMRVERSSVEQVRQRLAEKKRKMKEDKERPPVVYDLDSRVAALQEEEAERKRQKREQKKQRKQENGHDAEPPVDEDMAAIMGFGNFGTTSQKS